jgi:hypothetical protein
MGTMSSFNPYKTRGNAFNSAMRFLPYAAPPFLWILSFGGAKESISAVGPRPDIKSSCRDSDTKKAFIFILLTPTLSSKRGSERAPYGALPYKAYAPNRI